MKDQLISFETAKLAKEKGLVLNRCKTAYTSENSVIYTEEGFYHETYVLAPTQSLLQRWLREAHKIIIEINWNQFSHKYYYCLKIPVKLIKESVDFNSYEESLEFGLFEALKLIKS